MPVQPASMARPGPSPCQPCSPRASVPRRDAGRRTWRLHGWSVRAARRLPDRSRVGHVAGDDLDARIVGVHAERREILAQSRGRPHEGADPTALGQEAFENVDAQEP